MSAHTPGPWVAELVGTTSAGPNGVDVYEIVAGRSVEGEPLVRVAEYVAEKDARLLAAAPKLLATLREVAGFADGDDRFAWEVRRMCLAAIAEVSP